MMRVVVAGGKLQGIEAAYLARQAGWTVALVDRGASPPAKGLCDQFYRLDILGDSAKLAGALNGADLVVPAIEDAAVLTALEQAGRKAGVPVACDPAAYAVTSSKKRSDRLLAEMGVPAPRYWPRCEFPLVAKPSEGSGSRGIVKITNKEELALFFEQAGPVKDSYVIQEFLQGRSHSIEVVGRPGCYTPLRVTDLHFDHQYDCQRVLAPTELSPGQETHLGELAVKIAGMVSLKGVMDVEVIDDRGTLKVLEIDARLPSQTPTAVYHCTGVNMLPLLYALFAKGRAVIPPESASPKGVVYEHVRVTPGKVETLGERIISESRCLSRRRGFFGADEALTDYRPGSSSWVATLIITESDRAQAWEKRCRVIENIRNR